MVLIVILIFILSTSSLVTPPEKLTAVNFMIFKVLLFLTL